MTKHRWAPCALWVSLSAVLSGCGTSLAPSAAAPGEPLAAAVASINQDPLFLPTPDPDPFYRAQGSLAGLPLGSLVESREIAFRSNGVPYPNRAWHLSYVTQRADGEKTLATAALVAPNTPNTYGRPVLVSFQHAYDSLGWPCLPTRTVTGGQDNSVSALETGEYVVPLLTLGWTVLVPDYQGPSHAWGAGLLSGRATLDAVRAALAFEPTALPADTPVGLWGYSGGAYATTWAAALHPQYAPELNVVGFASGGTAVDLVDIVARTQDTPAFNFTFTSVIGAAREYPSLLPTTQLTERGKAAVDAQRDACLGIPAEGKPTEGTHFADYIAVPDFLNAPSTLAVRAQLSLLQQPLLPTAPGYLYHQINDELVPIDTADLLVQRWCEGGVPLVYERSAVTRQTLPSAAPNSPANQLLAPHAQGAILGAPTAVAFLNARLGGVPSDALLLAARPCP